MVGFGQSDIDVLHYKFNIGLNDVNDTIQGVAEIKVKFLVPKSEVILDLTNVGPAGKGMKTGSIKFLNPSSEITYQLSGVNEKVETIKTGISHGINVRGSIHKDEKLRILLGKEMKVNDTATFIIPYSGIPADGLIISKTKYGHRGFFADNWPDRGHNWIPCHDDPADKATVEFIVTAPEHYQVVAMGFKLKKPHLVMILN
jgi:hypothetical protein